MSDNSRRLQPRFFATAAKGTEPLLRDELSELGLSRVRADRGGVHFGAELRDAYRACLWSRIAQRTKDAVVDQLRERLGARPSVDRQSPDVLLFVHLVKDRATIYLDYSGDSLHEHGFRTQQGVAPIKETLAAALVRYSGWDRASPLVDPMCGSGTLLIEAGLWAAQRAPGLSRSNFGFERWADFDPSAARTMKELRQEAQSVARPLEPSLIGSDTDAQVLEAARANAEQAGLRVHLRLAPLSSAAPNAPRGGLLINPPYGERLGRSSDLGSQLAGCLRRFEAYQRALILPRGFELPLRADRFLLVYNGAIECELRRYDAVKL